MKKYYLSANWSVDFVGFHLICFIFALFGKNMHLKTSRSDQTMGSHFKVIVALFETLIGSETFSKARRKQFESFGIPGLSIC